jgi:hypothetical protein
MRLALYFQLLAVLATAMFLLTGRAWLCYVAALALAAGVVALVHTVMAERHLPHMSMSCPLCAEAVPLHLGLWALAHHMATEHDRMVVAFGVSTVPIVDGTGQQVMPPPIQWTEDQL